MHHKKVENVLKMSGRERVLYFIRKVADFEEVWGLFDNGWAMTADDEERKAIPFWPEKEFAHLCAKGIWKSYNPKQIELENFLSKWLPGMDKDGVLVAIFPTPDNNGVIIHPKDLLASLEEEIDQYE